MSNPPRTTVGLIGCGGIVSGIYVPVLQSLPELVGVSAVCDLRKSAAAKMSERLGNINVFTDIKTMLRETKMDAVLVFTSPKASASVAREVLKANLPVYLEKPPAVSSSELEELIAAEARSAAYVYTAFNRRHVPLFSELDFSGEDVQRVSGALRRIGRSIPDFSTTAVHLIDSVQYYAGSLFRNWKIAFTPGSTTPGSTNSCWTLDGNLENGAECSLQLIPDGIDFAEFLIFETKTQIWELQFPNNQAAVPEGLITTRSKTNALTTTKTGDKTLASFEAMGFRPCLRDFIINLEKRKEFCRHRPSSCRPNVRIMEEMESKLRDNSQVTHYSAISAA